MSATRSALALVTFLRCSSPSSSSHQAARQASSVKRQAARLSPPDSVVTARHPSRPPTKPARTLIQLPSTRPDRETLPAEKKLTLPSRAGCARARAQSRSFSPLPCRPPCCVLPPARLEREGHLAGRALQRCSTATMRGGVASASYPDAGAAVVLRAHRLGVRLVSL